RLRGSGPAGRTQSVNDKEPLARPAAWASVRECSPNSPPAAGTLRGDERMRRIGLRWGLYAYLLQDRTELVTEPACGILRLPHLDNAEAALSLSGDVNQKSFDGPVRRGVDALAVSELSHRFLVALPRQTCSLMNEYDRHGYLLGWSKRRKTTTPLRREATLLSRHRTGNLPAR